jgi:hypothetical protein
MRATVAWIGTDEEGEPPVEWPVNLNNLRQSITK